MLKLHAIVGHRDDPALAERLHPLAHRDGIEYLDVPAAEAERRRLRWATDRGTDCAISLPREQRLADGAVLLLEPERAIVVRVGEPRRWRLRPATAEAALRLGWHAGHLHWRVRFADGDLVVLLDGDESDYRARLAPLLQAGAVSVVGDHERA
jgi:urease accessory protein